MQTSIEHCRPISFSFSVVEKLLWAHIIIFLLKLRKYSEPYCLMNSSSISHPPLPNRVEWAKISQVSIPAPECDVSHYHPSSMSCGQLFFSDNAIKTSVLGKYCPLNRHIWDPVQWNILGVFGFFSWNPCSFVFSHYDPLLIDSFVLSPSRRLSACLLFSFVLPSVHNENSLGQYFC